MQAVVLKNKACVHQGLDFIDSGCNGDHPSSEFHHQIATARNGGCGPHGSLDSPEQELEKLATTSECDLLSGDGRESVEAAAAAAASVSEATTPKVQLVQVTPSVVLDTSQTSSTVKRVVIPEEETKCCVIL